MVTQFTSAKELIARIEHDFTIDFSDWIAKAPLWLADALAQLDVVDVWIDTFKEIDIVDYRGTMPCNVKMLRGIDHNGLRLKSRHKIISPFYDRSWLFLSNEAYELHGDRNIITSFREGTVTVLYKTPAVEYWQEHNITLPRIPDNPFVIEALKWFVMMRILQKGTKHPTFSLRENNVYVNPAMAWTAASKRAKNHISRLTPDQRREMSGILRTFIVDLNYSEDIVYPTNANINPSDDGIFTTEFTKEFD